MILTREQGFFWRCFFSTEVSMRLVLGICKLKGELTLSSSGYPHSKYTGAKYMHKLRSVEIHQVALASKVMISGKYCPSLEKLVLHTMPGLDEVHLWRVRSMKCPKMSKCRKLKSVSRNLDQGKLEELIIHDCPQLEELPGFTLLCYLDSIQVKDYFKLPVNGNEDLEEIEYLHLSNGQYSAT